MAVGEDDAGLSAEVDLVVVVSAGIFVEEPANAAHGLARGVVGISEGEEVSRVGHLGLGFASVVAVASAADDRSAEGTLFFVDHAFGTTDFEAPVVSDIVPTSVDRTVGVKVGVLWMTVGPCAVPNVKVFNVRIHDADRVAATVRTVVNRGERVVIVRCVDETGRADLLGVGQGLSLFRGRFGLCEDGEEDRRKDCDDRDDDQELDQSKGVAFHDSNAPPAHLSMCRMARCYGIIVKLLLS